MNYRSDSGQKLRVHEHPSDQTCHWASVFKPLAFLVFHNSVLFKVFQRVLMARVWSQAMWLRLNMCDGSVLKVTEDFLTCLMFCCMYVNCREYQHLHYRYLNYPKMLVNTSNSIYTDSSYTWSWGWRSTIKIITMVFFTATHIHILLPRCHHPCILGLEVHHLWLFLLVIL